MASANGDRNLLFGILALQMDFIGRDALVKAMHAWVLDKAKGLGQILVEQGALSAGRCSMLEPLVQEHVKQHGDDAGKSLASVSSVGSARAELQQIADPEVQASLAHVPAARPAAGDSYATDPPSAGAPSAVGRRFRILRPHAKGGLGEVFVARDEELNREVALKEIQERHADHPESRARFLVEAEITGGLEHPGIVPVYGLGTYADGRPFYAMRFIKGDSLKEAVERFHKPEARHRPVGERSLELRKLLGRFVDVCEAIGYAHSRGVLHRDLKPGNVMLGKYGETLVVDWGLAKSVGRAEQAESGEEQTLLPASASGSAETLPGKAIGTPAYMSPEQAAGRLEQMGPASDVYGLGATLYTLLTGKPPFSDPDVGAVLRKVERGDFPRPRQVHRGVPPALEAICLKAMALKAGDRYASARALADDVEHWLADEPVSVYRERWTERVVRWARRRPSAAAFLALFVFTLIAGAGVSTWLAIVANARAGQAEKSDLATKAALKNVEEEKQKTADALARTEETLAIGLFRPIGNDAGNVTDPEIEALWDVARANECVRILFIQRALEHPKTARQLRNRADMALHAAIGLDPIRRAQLEETLLTRLRDGGSNLDFRADCVFIGLALDSWGPEFTEAAAKQALEGMSKNDKLHALRVLAPLLRPEMALSAALQALEATDKAVNGGEDWADAVAAFAPQLGPEGSSIVAKQTLVVMTKIRGPFAREHLAQALAKLAARLGPEDLSAVFHQVLATGETEDGSVLDLVLLTVPALAPQLGSTDASTAAAQIELRILAKQEYVSYYPYQVKEALAALVPRMSQADVSTAAQRTQEAMAKTKDAHSLLTGHELSAAEQANILEIEKRLGSLAAMMNAFAPRLEPEEASAAAEQILAAMAKTPDPEDLVNASTDLAPRLEPKEAARYASLAAQRVQPVGGESSISEATRRQAKAIAALAPWLAPEKTSGSFRRILIALKAKWGDNELEWALDDLAPHLGQQDALKAVQEVADAMDERVGHGTPLRLVYVLDALVRRLPPSEASRPASVVIGHALGYIKGLDRLEHVVLVEEQAQACAIAAGWLDPEKADACANNAAWHVGDMIDDATDPDALKSGGGMVAALAPRLSAQHASIAMGHVLAAMRKTSDHMVLARLADAAAALALRLGPDEPTTGAQELLQAMGKTTDADALQSLAGAVSALTVQPGPEEGSQRTRFLAWAVGNSTPSQAPMTGLALLLEASKPSPGRFTEQQLVDLLKMPTCCLPARQVIVRQLGWQCGQPFANQWEFVEWARQHRPDLDLTSPPTRP